MHCVININDNMHIYPITQANFDQNCPIKYIKMALIVLMIDIFFLYECHTVPGTK